jgi:hypothetical protein
MHRMHAITHTHTPTHTHCKQSKRQVSSPRRPHAAPPSAPCHGTSLRAAALKNREFQSWVRSVRLIRVSPSSLGLKPVTGTSDAYIIINPSLNPKPHTLSIQPPALCPRDDRVCVPPPLLLLLCVCVCVCERERERERELGTTMSGGACVVCVSSSSSSSSSCLPFSLTRKREKWQ